MTTGMKVISPQAPEAKVSVAQGDSELLAAMSRGDREAGEELVRRHCQPLLRYLRRLTGSAHLAEEIHQQTWLSVLEHAGRFDASFSGGFKAWVFRIATNKVHDFWRSHGRQKSAHQGLRLVSEIEWPEAGHRLESGEQEHKLKQALDQLPQPQRQIVLLRYYSGLKFVDIAQMLGCPLYTDLGRAHKALLKLRELMD